MPKSKSKKNDREKSFEEMLEEAYAHPGIPEAMRVYNDWHPKDLNPGTYRDIGSAPPAAPGNQG